MDIALFEPDEANPFETFSNESAPAFVTAVGQLQDDIRALHALFGPDLPPLQLVRPSRTATAIYGFGDASGTGFGTTLLIDGCIHYCHGQWTTSHSEASSNYRELNNLILGMEEPFDQGLLDDCEVFLFADNSTVESAFHKGTSSSRTLFQLILRLWVLHMHRGLFIKVIRLSSGVLRGNDMLSYMPLHLSALERSEALKPWIQSWFQPSEGVSFLQPLGWFTSMHQAGSHVWAPPPGAADVALEQLAIAIHKRPNNHHLVIIPRLMTAAWRKLLGKICDLVFTVPLGVPFWSDSHFEPLLLGLYFPLLPCSPWQLRYTHLLDGLAQQLSSLPRSSYNWGGIFCANFSSKRGTWPECRRAWHRRCYVATDNGEFPIACPQDETGEFMILDEDDKKRFLKARDGDNLLTPFQCDHCHFANIMKREPLEDLASDVRLMKSIRRVNLDGFWSREPGTVRGALDEMKRGLGIATQLGFAQNLFPPRGPFPQEDTMGMGPEVVIVQKSLAKGRHGANVQYETVRKFRAAASNSYHSSAQGQGEVVMAKEMRKLAVTQCPTYSDFFERFNKGLHKRMGEVVRPNRAISMDILMEIFNMLETEWAFEPGLEVALEGAFYTIAFCVALRGEEVEMVKMRGIRKHWDQAMAHEELPNIAKALLGRFKNEMGEAYHLMPMLARTPRGLKRGVWVRRVLDCYTAKKVFSRYMFRNANGTKAKAKLMEPKFHDRLTQVQHNFPHLLDPEVVVVEEYGVSRSFRRGGTSKATSNGALPHVVELNGRWRKVNQSGVSRPSITIREHYMDVRLTLKPLLAFTSFL